MLDFIGRKEMITKKKNLSRMSIISIAIQSTTLQIVAAVDKNIQQNRKSIKNN